MSTLALLLLAASLAAEPAPAPGPDLETLSVRELTGPRGPSRRARALAGQRVRLLGFMARQEEATPGGFWLASRPVECDESGAGTGDLPPGAVRVVAPEGPAAPIDGPIAVTGRLEVGGGAASGAPPSLLVLHLDPPSHPAPQ